MNITVAEKLKSLSNKELIQLSEELRLPTIPENALIREVIKGTEMDSTAIWITFIGVGQLLAFELADRLIIAEDRAERASYKRDAIDMG